MGDIVEIQISHESSFMVTNQPAPKPRWVWFALAGVLAGLALLGLFLWSVLRPLPLPTGESLFVIVTPSSAVGSLSSSQLEHLPPSWRAVVKSRTMWPVILVLDKDALDQWTDFAYAPRWVSLVGFDEQSLGLMKRIAPRGGNPTGLGEGTRYLYTILSRWRYFTRSFVARWRTGTEELPLVSLFGTSNGVLTDVEFEHSIQGEPLKMADLSVDFVSVLNMPLLDHLAFAGQSLTQWPVPISQYNLELNEQGTPVQTSVRFSDAPNATQFGELLTKFGIADVMPFDLPDGSVGLARLPVTVSGTSFATSTRWGLLNWSDRDLSIGSTTNTLQTAQPCNKLRSVLRADPRLARRLLPAPLSELVERTIQVGEKDGELAICFE